MSVTFTSNPATSAATTAAAPADPAATIHTVLRAKGFTCPSCVKNIETTLDRLPGVDRTKVQFASQRIEVDHDPALTDVDALVDAVAKAGYQAQPIA